MPLPAGTWPVPDEARDGWWEGLPYPFYDMRPQGYMGRQFALAARTPGNQHHFKHDIKDCFEQFSSKPAQFSSNQR